LAFLEWSEGLDDIDVFEFKKRQHRLDACLNLLLISALDSAVKIGKYIGCDNRHKYYEVHENLQRSFHRVFWDSDRRRYASFRTDKTLYHYSQLIQAMAVIYLDQDSLKTGLLKNLSDCKSMVPTELSNKLFLYTAMLTQRARYAGVVLEDVRKSFGSMLQHGATSLWEVVQGANAFDGAGSLCHGWSAIFNYIAGAYILGVRPREAGFKTFVVEPRPGDLTSAEGTVPTPAGNIHLKWKNSDDCFEMELHHPEQLTARLKLPTGKRQEVFVNNKKWSWRK
jgi:hypothetical protein